MAAAQAFTTVATVVALLSAGSTARAAEPATHVPSPELRHGSWRVAIDPSSVYVWARGDGKTQLGLYCSRGLDTCVHYLISAIPCEGDAPIPAVVNARTRALAVTLRCLPIGPSKALVLSDFDEVHAALRDGGSVGIVVPLPSGKFEVSRFNTDRFSEALTSARQARRAAANPAPPLPLGPSPQARL